MASVRKSLMGILSLFFNRKDKKRRFHILHYEMWDYIAGELEKAKARDLRASNFVGSLKESFCRVNSKNDSSKMTFCFWVLSLPYAKEFFIEPFELDFKVVKVESRSRM